MPRLEGGSTNSLRSNRCEQQVWSLALIKICIALMAIGITSTAYAVQESEDVVITQRRGSEKTSKRRGEIVDWKGMSLTIHSTGRDREIDNSEIVDIQTAWSKSYLDGISALKKGKTRVAIERLNAALVAESRPWAQRIIRAHLIDAYQTIEQHGDAVQQFLQILAQDPNTRFLHLAPLPWTGSGNSLVQQAEKWLEVKEPSVQLVAASWLVAGPRRGEAIKVLDGLSRDIDARIRFLAIAQLWRTRTNVNAKQTDVWADLIEKMPRAQRAGPLYVLANAQSQCQKVDEAIIGLMRIPILYPEQRSLAAAALYRSAGLLHNKGQTKQAKSLLNELVSKYPDSFWAQQANQE